MNQNKKLLKLAFALTAAVFLFSCEKKNNRLRAAGSSKGGVGISADPNGNAKAQQENAMQNIGVDILYLYTPDFDGDRVVLSTDLNVRMQEVKSLPITTQHSKSGSDSFGQLTLAQGLILKISARCEGADCNTYYFLASLEFNGQIRSQVMALSYAQDCHFYKDLIPSSNYKRSID